MRIGASGRPTVSRRAAVSARTCSGPPVTLRPKRMKPHGRTLRKNAFSCAVSFSPAQPRMDAETLSLTRGTHLRRSLDEAGLPGGLQLVAEGRGVGAAGEAGDLGAEQGLAVLVDLFDALALAGGGAGRDRGRIVPTLVGQRLGREGADLHGGGPR